MLKLNPALHYEEELKKYLSDAIICIHVKEKESERQLRPDSV